MRAVGRRFGNPSGGGRREHVGQNANAPIVQDAPNACVQPFRPSPVVSALSCGINYYLVMKRIVAVKRGTSSTYETTPTFNNVNILVCNHGRLFGHAQCVAKLTQTFFILGYAAHLRRRHDSARLRNNDVAGQELGTTNLYSLVCWMRSLCLIPFPKYTNYFNRHNRVRDQNILLIYTNGQRIFSWSVARTASCITDNSEYTAAIVVDYSLARSKGADWLPSRSPTASLHLDSYARIACSRR